MLTPVVLLFALLSFFPIKWAAAFTDGRNTGLLACATASILAPVLAVSVFRLSGGGFNGVAMAYPAMLASYVSMLRIPARSIPGFAVVVLALQLAAVGAFVSFNKGRLAVGS